jgi:hypothetical protein
MRRLRFFVAGFSSSSDGAGRFSVVGGSQSPFTDCSRPDDISHRYAGSVAKNT